MNWTRLIDGGGGGFERDLLGSARGDVTPSAARERVAERLGISTAAASPSFEPSAPRSWLASRRRQSPSSRRVELTKLGKLTVLGLIGAFAPLSAVLEVDTPRPPLAPVAAAEQAVDTSAELPVPPVGVGQPELPVPPVGVGQPEPLSPALVEADPPRVLVASPPQPRIKLNPRPIELTSPEPKSQLMAEVQRLDAARAALRASAPHRALVLLDDYEKDFARGELVLEAAVLRVRTLTQSGQPTEAARLARRLLSRPSIERYRTELERVVSGEQKRGSPGSPRDIGSAR